MSEQTECPICMDAIDINKNCVTTECGHKFHCSCLMQNAAHNGFGCPFCRTAMAEEPAEEDDEDNWSDVSEEDEDELYDDYVLRGLRFMTNNLEGQPHDILDVADEEWHLNDNAEPSSNTETEVPLPNAAYIATKLAAQGVTMEQLVKALLVDHGEYEEHGMFDELDNTNGEIFGKMRIIISNYSPDEPAIAPAATQSQPSTPLPAPVSVPSAPIRSAAEPKVSMISPRRLSMEFSDCINE